MKKLKYTTYSQPECEIVIGKLDITQDTLDEIYDIYHEKMTRAIETGYIGLDIKE